jgi:hypothetical protein
MADKDPNRGKRLHERYRRIHDRRMGVWTREPSWSRLKPKFQRIWNELYDELEGESKDA